MVDTIMGPLPAQQALRQGDIMGSAQRVWALVHGPADMLMVLAMAAVAHGTKTHVRHVWQLACPSSCHVGHHRSSSAEADCAALMKPSMLRDDGQNCEA